MIEGGFNPEAERSSKKPRKKTEAPGSTPLVDLTKPDALDDLTVRRKRTPEEQQKLTEQMVVEDLRFQKKHPEVFAKGTEDSTRPTRVAKGTGNTNINEANLRGNDYNEEDESWDDITQVDIKPLGLSTNDVFDKEQDVIHLADEDLEEISTREDLVNLPQKEYKKLSAQELKKIRENKTVELNDSDIEEISADDVAQLNEHNLNKLSKKEVQAIAAKDLQNIRAKISKSPEKAPAPTFEASTNQREDALELAQLQYVQAYRKYNPKLKSKEDGEILEMKPPTLAFTIFNRDKVRKLERLYLNVKQAENNMVQEEKAAAGVESFRRSARLKK
ncbi:MAG: hypothetical protein HYT15_03305 [Candidatus Magasanikbacteria bacterium]|nr:hypothetical protein [Candidatus Magasanikbacteria bacterium]